MGNLKKITAVVVLTCGLGLSAIEVAAQTPSCDPGETHGPPCVSTQMTSDTSETSGMVSTPSASTAGTANSVADVAIGLVESLLPIF